MLNCQDSTNASSTRTEGWGWDGSSKSNVGTFLDHKGRIWVVMDALSPLAQNIDVTHNYILRAY
jgi:hypothetical protein